MLGRFTRIDPANDGWNLYSYARNNPVNYVDSNGTEASPSVVLYQANRIARIASAARTASVLSRGTAVGLAVGLVMDPSGVNGPRDRALAEVRRRQQVGNQASASRRRPGGGIIRRADADITSDGKGGEISHSGDLTDLTADITSGSTGAFDCTFCVLETISRLEGVKNPFSRDDKKIPDMKVTTLLSKMGLRSTEKFIYTTLGVYSELTLLKGGNNNAVITIAGSPNIAFNHLILYSAKLDVFFDPQQGTFFSAAEVADESEDGASITRITGRKP